MNVCDDKKKSDCKDAIPDATNEKINNLSKCSDEVPNRNKENVDDILKHEANNDIGLSKNQLKKRRRKERAIEQNKKRKEYRKELKRAKALKEGRDLDEERRQQAELAKQENSSSKQKSERIWNEKREEADKRFRICVDCSFDSQMTTKELNSLSNQLRCCYSANRRSKNPVHFSVSSLGGETLNYLQKIDGFPDKWKMRAFTCSDKCFSEMHDKSKVVYLTSDSNNEINELDDDKVYIIGGIVDRNRLKRATIDKAENLGLGTAKLPIGQHLQLFSTKVLTINHVFEILLKYREYNDWKKAMLDVLPTRKDIHELEKKHD